MADEFHYVALVQQDTALQQREIACAAIEGIPDPAYWVPKHSWDFAKQPTWGAKWKSAIDGGVENPGQSGAVISDADILTATQAIRNAEAEVEG